MATNPPDQSPLEAAQHAPTVLMSFRDRMTSDVGDADPVWRYLLEKAAHTALIAWLLVCATGLSLFVAAVAAAAAYDLVGKALWLREARRRAITHAQGDALVGVVYQGPRYLAEDGTAVLLGAELRDAVFDLWVGLLPAVLTRYQLPGYAGPAALAGWMVLFVVLDEWRWGRPS